MFGLVFPGFYIIATVINKIILSVAILEAEEYAT